MLCSVELTMDVEHPKPVFHKTKTCSRLSGLRDFVAASEKLPLLLSSSSSSSSSLLLL